MEIDFYLSKTNFQKCIFDNNVYIKKYMHNSNIISFYVHDLFIFTNYTRNMLPKVREWLKSKFEMRHKNDQLSYGLGIEVTRDKNKRIIHLNQSKHITNIFKRFNMENSKPIHTPLKTIFKLTKDQGPQSNKKVIS